MNDAARASQTSAAASIAPAEVKAEARPALTLAGALDVHVSELHDAYQALGSALKLEGHLNLAAEHVRYAHQVLAASVLALAGLARRAWGQEHALNELRAMAAVTVGQLEAGNVEASDLVQVASLAVEGLER